MFPSRTLLACLLALVLAAAGCGGAGGKTEQGPSGSPTSSERPDASDEAAVRQVAERFLSDKYGLSVQAVDRVTLLGDTARAVATARAGGEPASTYTAVLSKEGGTWVGKSCKASSKAKPKHAGHGDEERESCSA